MSCSPDAEGRVWIALGSAPLLEMLIPLRDEHLRRGEALLVECGAGDIDQIVSRLGAARRASLLIVEDPATPSARSRHGSPFNLADGEAAALIGWIRLDAPALANYARRAATLLKRGRDAPSPVVLLGPRERRYMALMDEVEAAMAAAPSLTTLRWTAERIRPTPMLDALRLGAAAILYAGHGDAHGWLAYGGLTAEGLTGGAPWRDEQAAALLFSLSCATGRATAPEASAGLADALIARGMIGAALAPMDDSLHENTRLLATCLARAMGAGASSLWDILDAARRGGASLDGYAVIGDPALRAAPAPDALRRGALVFAPAPDMDLGDVTAAAPRWC
jgi:hypothetical protein